MDHITLKAQSTIISTSGCLDIFLAESSKRVIQKILIQQEVAPSHTAKKVQNYLRSKFGEKFIDKKRWPPRSPDLNPCDFYLWGYLKSKVYNPLPNSLEELKMNIEREIKIISKEELKRVFLNFEKRCYFLIQAKGGHIEE